MTDNYVQTETARAPTVVQIRKQIRQRVELTDETTKAEVVVDVAKDVGVAQQRVADELDELMKAGELYFVGAGATAEVRLV
jgi:DNA replicative helicase MCM subunit Mcm2 (Cdc46/Mcm family)